MIFTLVQRTINGSQTAGTVTADSRDDAIMNAEEIFTGFCNITYIALKEGIAHRNDPEFWSKAR